MLFAFLADLPIRAGDGFLPAVSGLLAAGSTLNTADLASILGRTVGVSEQADAFEFMHSSTTIIRGTGQLHPIRVAARVLMRSVLIQVLPRCPASCCNRKVKVELSEAALGVVLVQLFPWLGERPSQVSGSSLIA